MNTYLTCSRQLLILTLFFTSSLSWGQWQLDASQSTVEFISVKNASVAESHHFGSLSGSISADGIGTLDIALDSVDTMIEIRDERMREFLFETMRFPSAKAIASVNPNVMAAAVDGTVVSTDISLQLSLHGAQQKMNVPVTLVGKGDRLYIFSSRPVIVNAADFELVSGVNKLREIAGLKSVSSAVPVTVSLVFERAE